ncbi:response regulator transcription factor [Paucisalibacillus globulus]|uniref:response regulator transcription factor n=1 Tax=Paucisalibacillus globulus TaxID=351095 RepID=UPI000BB751C7|nr:response regulator transcription factor [Paucisalibacillus globulus]
MKRILIADDDPYILQLVSIHLSQAGYQVHLAKDGTEAVNILINKPCDLAVVDIMMPFMDGFTLTKHIRKKYDIPVILLTAKNELDDKEEGFRSGTDDYLVKPFEPKELLLRIEALLRRYNKQPIESFIKLGMTTINKHNYEVQIGDRTVILPLKEFDLLYFLASYPMQVFTRNQIIEQVWGLDFEGDERTVDVHIKRLRERFTNITNDFQIKTIRGVGYLLEVK